MTAAGDRYSDGVLYNTARTRVTRRPAAPGGAGVIRKQPLGPGADQRRRHELSILTRLSGLAGVPTLTAGAQPDEAIDVIDVGGTTLTEAAPAHPLELLDLAERIALLVADVHRRGVVHKDINPSNILVTGSPPQPALIDFEVATTFAEEQPAFAPQTEIAGTLTYLAPEQTGRTGRPVDQRADLYALGVTLYELATGRPPFDPGDPLQLIHDHLARVPPRPDEVNPAVPPTLSGIVMRLLEKEPDQRYQSAEGLAHDLGRAREHPDQRFPLGERDFPLRLTPPARLVGRDDDIAALHTALDRSRRGEVRAVLISGASGVGKTALADELRPVVAAAGGWFVTGRFDQHRQDPDADAVRQALRALGRLLLAEPPAELARLRERILAAVGLNADLIAAVVPEFGALLGVNREIGEIDPRLAESRLAQAGLDLVRGIATAERPVVIVVDDLQWAGPVPLRLIDALVGAPALRGVLVVGAYRDAEVDAEVDARAGVTEAAEHPFAAICSRWERLGVQPERLHLANLPPTAIAGLLAEMMRLDPADAARLAEAIGTRTGGNPYETVETVNGLRREGVLVPGADGWTWDPGTVRRYLGRGDVQDLLYARIDALPGPGRDVLEIVTALGGETPMDLLLAAIELDAPALEAALLPALEDGLLALDGGGPDGGGSVRIPHDRVRQAVQARGSVAEKAARHLILARRLAATADSEAGFATVAAEQYRLVVDQVTDPDERALAVRLFRAATARARLLSSHAVVERFVDAALALLPEGDVAGRVELEIDRHAALFGLGRLAEADESYRFIEAHATNPLRLAEAACTQVSSLTNRGRLPDAVALGLDRLRLLGQPAPAAGNDSDPADSDPAASDPAAFDPAAFDGDVQRSLDVLNQWLDTVSAAEDLARPEVTDPRMLAIAKLIDRVLPAAFFSGSPALAWLTMASCRLWAEHGPCAALVGPVSHIGTVVGARDYRAAERMARRILAASQARGYEPEASQSRFLFALCTAPWFEPLEEAVRHARQARDGLVQGGDLQNATYSHFAVLPALLDCAPTLDSYLAGAEGALAFGERTSNDIASAVFVMHRQLARALRGDTEAPDSFTDGTFDEAAHLTAFSYHPVALTNFHIAHAVAAAVFGDRAGLIHHAGSAMARLPAVSPTYSQLFVYLLQGLALAERVRAATGPDGDPAEVPALLAELDAIRDMLAGRAEDAPGNFRHLLRLIEAERAWATDDFRAAMTAYDAARLEVVAQARVWHRALIAERAARFHLSHGLECAGRSLLADARAGYEQWGAVAKVRQLDDRYPYLRAAARPAVESGNAGRGGSVQPGYTSTFTADAVDLMGVLTASRALSSETNLHRLRARVVNVLSALTGATSVRMLMRDRDEWVLPADDGDEDGPPLGLTEAGARGLVAVSAVHYVDRTREPLVVSDATRDGRFQREPCFAGVDACSLLVIPIQARGALQAIVVLENRLSHGAFTADRLDGVMLISGQLAVSLDNALVYASLERKVAERTAELALTNERLELLSVTDALTGLANRRRLTDVLEAEWRRAASAKEPVAVAMVDVDHFKLYNDHYGHPAGDECLRRVAAVLAVHVRGSIDLVARYGGEEFLIVLADSDLDAAFRVAERARAAVEALALPHEKASRGYVTVSIGVASMIADEGTGVQSLINAADANLYQAKRDRNRVWAD
jgi:diguanylate cyclase (GGDEF)-like protein